MKKFLKVLGIFILTIIMFLLIDTLFLYLYLSWNVLEYNMIYSIRSSIYTLAGLLGVCTYLLYSKK
jgi:hypothetical protein